MNSADPTIVIIDDLPQLVALDKVLREAKFSSSPIDSAIAASPIVADLSRMVRAAIIARTGGNPERPLQDAMIRPGWPEWGASVQAARRLALWSTWTRSQKAEVARDLLSPFEVSDDDLALFLNEADSVRNPHA